MRHRMLPKLSKDYILEHISQEQIFAEVFNISLADIDHCISTGDLIHAPYRDDNDASFGFKYDAKGKLRGKDFGNYFWGDCFDAVGFVYHLNPNNRQDFGRILEMTAKLFNIHKYANRGSSVSKRLSLARNKKEKPKLTIDIRPRKINIHDAEYWYHKYNINRNTLKHYDVIPVYDVYFNNAQVYEYDPADPCYAYYLGTKNGRKQYKLYYPLRKERRFYGNGSLVQGIRQIKTADFGIITKSLKDVMCFHSLGINAIAPYSEGQLLTRPQMDYIRNKWKFVITLSDFDITGIRFGCNMRRKFNTYPLWLTNGDYATYNFGAKDISDYIDKYGFDQAQKLVDNFIENDFEFDDNFFIFVNSLKHY